MTILLLYVVIVIVVAAVVATIVAATANVVAAAVVVVVVAIFFPVVVACCESQDTGYNSGSTSYTADGCTKRPLVDVHQLVLLGTCPCRLSGQHTTHQSVNIRHALSAVDVPVALI